MTIKQRDFLRYAKCWECPWEHHGTGAELKAQQHCGRTGHAVDVSIELQFEKVSDASSDLVQLARSLAR